MLVLKVTLLTGNGLTAECWLLALNPEVTEWGVLLLWHGGMLTETPGCQGEQPLFHCENHTGKDGGEEDMGAGGAETYPRERLGSCSALLEVLLPLVSFALKEEELDY